MAFNIMNLIPGQALIAIALGCICLFIIAYYVVKGYAKAEANQ